MKTIKKRLIELDIATGIAIFLVVIGHFASRNDPNDIYWYVILKIFIYKFHMPFFMFLSGSIFYYHYKNTSTIKEYTLFVKKKALRLMPGFIIIGFTIIFGKYIASYFLYVDNNSTDILKNIFNIFIFPSESVAGGLWYIYVLFLLFVIFQIFNYIFKKNIFSLLLLSLLLHISLYFIEITNLFMIDKIFEYSIYFNLGYLYIMYRIKILLFLKKNNILSLIIIFLFILSFNLIYILDEEISKTIIGFLSIPSLLYIIIKTKFFKVKKFFLYLSEYTYTIYLLNTILIGITKGILLKTLSWGGNDFIIMSPIFLIVGLFGPIFVHTYLIKNKYLSKIMK